jgi:hypothetical protein
VKLNEFIRRDPRVVFSTTLSFRGSDGAISKSMAKLLFVLSLFFLSLAPRMANSASHPQKPVWPLQWSSAFGLYQTGNPPKANVSSMFYSKWTAQTKAQLIDYPTQCIDIGPLGVHPCKLLFVPAGIYLSSPFGDTCCLLIPGVGPIPPNFLRGYNFSNVETAADYYGTLHVSNHWVAPDFEYWTDVKTGFDVALLDGPTIKWTWANFDVRPQPDSLFKIPQNCTAACPKFLTSGKGRDELARFRALFRG